MLESFVIIFWLGIINLLKLVWSDLDSLSIDARPSWLMTGVVLACFWLSGRALEMVFIAIVFIFLLNKIKKYSGLVGLAEGDVTVLAWVLPGLWLFGYWTIPIFIACYISNLFIMSRLLNKNSGLPATFPIAIAFCITWAIVGIGLI